MGVAGIDVAPGIDDRDHRLAGIVGAVVAHLRGARPVPERPQVLDPVPAVTAKFLRFLPGHALFLPPRPVAPVFLMPGSNRDDNANKDMIALSSKYGKPFPPSVRRYTTVTTDRQRKQCSRMHLQGRYIRPPPFRCTPEVVTSRPNALAALRN